MTGIASSIPGEILYQFATKHQSVDELYHTLYEHPTEIAKKHFMAVNSHLDQQVRPGQMVIITPPGAQQCTVFEGILSEAANRIDQQLEAQSEEEAKVIAENYELLSNVADYSGEGHGVALEYFKQHKTQVEYILTEIERLHLKTYRLYGKFNTDEFFRHRKLLFQQLDDVLKSLVGRGYVGLDIDRGKIKRSLGFKATCTN